MILSPSDVKKILLIRTDRIGDVMLSLPMLPRLKKHYPNAKITIMVQKYTKELVEHNSMIDNVITWQSNGNRSFFEYISILRSENFDIAILPYPRFNLALITFLSGISNRVGTGYRWYSFLFNHKVYEHRKDAKRHEVEYNLNLLGALGIEASGDFEFEFYISSESRTRIDEVLKKEDIKKFVVLHIGSGGSARDWPIEKFADLGDVIQSEFKIDIVFTGSESENGLVLRATSLMKSQFKNFSGKFSLQELGALFQRASVFISNSTGPLHIASAVGTPVVAFYPPILQCNAVRWGPYTEKKRIFSASNQKCELCKGERCRSNVCMNQITVEDVVKAVRELINEYHT